MRKPYSAEDLSNVFDTDLTWRRKELSDLKSAVKLADDHARTSLLKSIVAMSYAHWEGYIKMCAGKYFEHIALYKKPYAALERQIYVNSFLVRLDALRGSRTSIDDRCSLINSILDSIDSRFAYVNPMLIDTKSNLNSEVIRDICTICGVDHSYFSAQKTFIDVILLKRRNAIAHGQQESIVVSELDEFISTTLSLMEHFRDLLENKVCTKTYIRS